ncbi:hypothetical protein BDW71DRAFT_19575 [Aspergillus fruticulosus]
MADLETIKAALAWIFIAPFLIAYALTRRRIRLALEWLERRARAPTPLPRRRHSLSESATTSGKQNRAHNQTQSIFFKLPPELRNIVYEEVLVSSAPLHVWRTHRRLCSRICKAERKTAWESLASKLHDKCLPPMASDGSVQRRSDDDDEPPRKDRFLPLLSSCRRLYSESISLLYSKNKLLIDDHRTLLTLPSVIPARQLNMIRSVYLYVNAFRDYHIDCDISSSWQQICTTLAGMEGLEDIRIALGYHTINIFRTMRITKPLPVRTLITLLTPLQDVKATTFRVQIPSRCELDDSIGGDGQTFAIEVRKELNDNCRCCSPEGKPGIEGLLSQLGMA